MVRICSADPVRLTSDFQTELASYSKGKEVLIHSPEGSTRRQRFHSALLRSESETEENFCAFWAIKRLCRRKITVTSGLWLKHSWDRGSWVNGSTIFQPGRIGSGRVTVQYFAPVALNPVSRSVRLRAFVAVPNANFSHLLYILQMFCNLEFAPLLYMNWDT